MLIRGFGLAAVVMTIALSGCGSPSARVNPVPSDTSVAPGPEQGALSVSHGAAQPGLNVGDFGPTARLIPLLPAVIAPQPGLNVGDFGRPAQMLVSVPAVIAAQPGLNVGDSRPAAGTGHLSPASAPSQPGLNDGD